MMRIMQCTSKQLHRLDHLVDEALLALAPFPAVES